MPKLFHLIKLRFNVLLNIPTHFGDAQTVVIRKKSLESELEMRANANCGQLWSVCN